MTTLYAWNTARASCVAYPNVREGRLFHPTRSRQFFGLCSIHLCPNKKIRPLKSEVVLEITLTIDDVIHLGIINAYFGASSKFCD
uniref:Uncharacterized protein n=1 Tax=Candidatus Kentrum sp. FM TaxID=2126340 RepID=A0A450W0F0_9GAMM|nr:MAG: hypothetical protein BECKFM1743A_GA0114220_100335 [Candidatus Kentron sp. FM]VFJ49739.1 MAG: hypothetical protein BECKFM1743C_GA0114222_100752 [Candidatus Kentron sp. FM]VFK10495.1 MAG: hypothetical protein BECKFM1743B_GA0114221_101423 [Candidatus Kentron sp. FM]